MRPPGVGASLTDREQWITAKYVEKRLLARPPGEFGEEALQSWLWDSVQRGDVKAGKQASATGVCVRHCRLKGCYQELQCTCIAMLRRMAPSIRHAHALSLPLHLHHITVACPVQVLCLRSLLSSLSAAAYHAIACGADVNHSYHTQPAARAVWECNLQAGGDADQPLSPSNLGHAGVLHAACMVGCPGCCCDAGCA